MTSLFPPPPIFPVLSFLEVYNRSVCRPREVLVDVLAEYPDEVEYLFIPSCVALTRCAGCCPDEALECTPVVTHNVTLQVRTAVLVCVCVCVCV